MQDMPLPDEPSSALHAEDLGHESDDDVSVDLEFEQHHEVNEFVEGPLEPAIATEQLPEAPPPLPVDGIQWSSIDLKDADQIRELWNFLFLNYVEDASEEFRFDYSVECLAWALLPPNYVPDWHVALRSSSSGSLVGFVAGVPLELRVRETTLQTVEINFLCVHRDSRGQRLAPALLAELSRRAQLRGVLPHLYTAAKRMLRVVSVTQYYHRTINVRKLVAVKFGYIPRGETLESQAAYYALSPAPSVPRLREMRDTPSDIEGVRSLWHAYSARFSTAVRWTTDEVRHHFLSARGVGAGDGLGGAGGWRRTNQIVWTYVVEAADGSGRITDFFSFFALSTSVLKAIKTADSDSEAPTPTPERAAADSTQSALAELEKDTAALERLAGDHAVDGTYLFYYASDVGVPANGAKVDEEKLNERLKALVGDALVIANNAGFDVFNCMTVMDNDAFLSGRDLKFLPGSGMLNWYLDGYRLHSLAGVRATEDTAVGRGLGVVMI
ncbi:acyl-CoA N-acyltransferase [Auriculariales sp. MPI-PUGE-AT-0066]|nr:acyl-CoA N-acyltransferase [Auriculariales sp. MPI-PUGE-AT-0066]